MGRLKKTPMKAIIANKQVCFDGKENAALLMATKPKTPISRL